MKKRIRITFNAPLMLGFALACTLVTILQQITGEEGAITQQFSTYSAPMSDPLMYVRLFTHVLGHKDFAHLFGNMAYILLLGPILEEKYGWKSMLVVILVTALITGIVHNLLFPNTRLLGASGVVFALILMTSFTQFREGEIPLTFILVALIYIGQQVWEGITVKNNVSNLTHILGGITGSAGGFLLNRRKKE